MFRIYDRTTGKCHICHRKLASNHHNFGSKGAWEVEHSRPRARGGSEHLNNLYAAHITCNREKGTITARTARARHGRKRAPLSKERRQQARRSNAVAGAILGGIIGSVAGPWGVFAGAAIGAKLLHRMDPDKG